MKTEKSCGVIPLKQDEGQWKILLIFHRGGRHWSFPKGHQDPGESDKETAIRELKEETGLALETFLLNKPYVEVDTFCKLQEQVSKTVCYFPAIVSGTLVLQQEEILDARWLSFKQALEHLTFEDAKAMCRKVEALISKQDGA